MKCVIWQVGVEGDRKVERFMLFLTCVLCAVGSAVWCWPFGFFFFFLALYHSFCKMQAKTWRQMRGQGEINQIAQMTSGHNSSIFEIAGNVSKIVGVMLLFVENDVTMTAANPSEATVLNAVRSEGTQSVS